MANLYSEQRREAHKAFSSADLAWSNALAFAPCGLSGRYTLEARGKAGSELRKLYDARLAAMAKWEGFINEPLQVQL